MSRRRERPLTTALGWRLPWWLLDFGPVAFIFLVGVAALGTVHAAGSGPHVPLFLGLVVATGGLLVRHRAPLIVLAVVLVIELALGWGPTVLLPVLLAMFTVAEYSDRSMVIGATLITGAATLGTLVIHHDHISAGTVVSRLVVIGLAVAVALYLRARADYINGLRERAERLERERELLAQQAVGDERVRIARELHDVVAHNVCLMVVQAQALAATSPEATQHETLGHVATSGARRCRRCTACSACCACRTARRRSSRPSPGCATCPTLIERACEAGLEVALAVEGSLPRPARRRRSVGLPHRPGGADQRDHARPRAPRWRRRSLRARRARALGARRRQRPRGDAGDPGHGLVGMRERVALFGGDARGGPRSDGAGYARARRSRPCLTPRSDAQAPPSDRRRPAADARRAFARCSRRPGEMEVVGEAGDGEEAVERGARQPRPTSC